MEYLEMGNAFTAALNARQWDTVASCLTDDFDWTSAATDTVDKPGFIAVEKAWFAAAPDHQITWDHRNEVGDMAHGTTGVSGTLTQPLVLPGMPPIPAAGKHFAATLETTITWRGNQMAAATTGPATPDIFAQLGVQLPA